MATFASAINTPAQNLASTLTTAISQGQTLATGMAPASIGGLSLTNLATTPKNWRSNLADLQIQLTAALTDLGSVNDRIQRIAALAANINSLD